MRKKNKLYTANRWNQPLFMQDNIFAEGGFSLSKPSGLNYSTPQLTKPTVNMPIDWGGYQGKIAVQNSQNLVNNFGKEASANNPFSGAKSKGGGMSSLASAGIGVGLGIAQNIGGDKYRNGAFDAMDPVYHLAGGRESTVGNGLSDAGVGLFSAGAQSGNGALMLAGAGAKILGGLTNAAFGTKWNKDTINTIESNTSAMRNGAETLNGAATSDDFLSRASGLSTAGLNFSKGDIGKDGWFTNKVGKKFRKLQNAQSVAQAFANHALTTGAENVDKNLDDSVFTNFAAFGGQLNPSDGGAIDYGFMSDYLTMRNNANKVKDKVSTNPFGNLPVTPISTFALGGDMQTNGSDFTDGLTHIDAGLSHEENPNQGVQVGINRDNGAPNLVEEGETIFDDYVFSKRLKPDAQTKAKFHVSKNADISFADLSKKLEKESEERPNDPISARGLTKQMHDLADEQERQKNEQQQREAEDAFAQLPPEQQQAIMQQVAMEEQQAQQQMQEQPTEQPPMEGQQEPQQQVDEQMMQQQAEQPQVEGNEQINACGGKMNRFDKGGDLKKKIYGLLGLHTDSDFDKWAMDKKVDRITDWENVLQNKQFLDAISGSNPALSDAISKGYDFGQYVPSKDNKLTFDFKHGGWGLENYDAWNGSTDAAWKEAVEKGLVKKGMNSEEIGKALSQTDAYKRGSDWLKADEGNRLTYLQSILNSQDAPQAARDYAAKYVDANGWLKDAKRDYQTIFEDPNGTGVRNTHPGTYWKTPNEILRDKQSGNYVINDDGTIEQIYGDVPKDWSSAGSYNWADANNDYAYNYYKRPVAADNTNGGKAREETEVVPVHKATWGRYAGLFGPAVGLGMQALGIGKPDYSRMDAAVEAASGAPALASYKPIGDYIGYRPMDIWYEQNRRNANSRATDRAILNNNSPIGTKMAGILANGYNEQLGSGNLYRQALEYNDAQRQKVADFNRSTNIFNANAFNQTSATNAQIQNNQRNFKAQMQMDAARQRMAADAAWNQGIYGNVSGLFKGLGDWGKENAQHNMIADMAADGIFGNMNDQYIGRGYITKRAPKKKSNGGKLNRRKRGLTF